MSSTNSCARGRTIATGGNGCDSLRQAMALVQSEIDAGNLTPDQAAYILGDIWYIEYLMGC
ncbi:MAG TPA: hypothetical protein VLV78_08100 [Thermoanaerobaculia bacterium]|nr:hypothetical protein [Thermoanaerobaculia bacterium]